MEKEKPHSAKPLDTAIPTPQSFPGCLFCKPIYSLVLSRPNEFFFHLQMRHNLFIPLSQDLLELIMGYCFLRKQEKTLNKGLKERREE